MRDCVTILVISAIAALLRLINVATVKIGLGGALVQFHPTYHVLLQKKLEDLAPDTCQVRHCLCLCKYDIVQSHAQSDL